jgi:peroxiredoxin
VPGTYVIDTGGIIRSASADADYTRRPEPEETVAALEAL